MSLHTGSYQDYLWLSSGDHQLSDLMRLCPQVVLDKYLVITAIDGGVLEVTDMERAAGWETRKGVAHSPRIKSLTGLPHEDRHGYCDVGFDEWYVFDTPPTLVNDARRTYLRRIFNRAVYGRLWVSCDGVFIHPIQ